MRAVCVYLELVIRQFLFFAERERDTPKDTILIWALILAGGGGGGGEEWEKVGVWRVRVGGCGGFKKFLLISCCGIRGAATALVCRCIVSLLLAVAPHGEPDSPTTVESHCAILMQMGVNQLHGEIVLIGLPLLRFVLPLPPEVGGTKSAIVTWR